MLIEVLHTNLLSIQGQMSQEERKEVKPLDKIEGQAMITGINEQQQIDSVRKEPPPIDYRLPQYVIYFQTKVTKKQNIKEMTKSLLFDCQSKLNNQISQGILRIYDSTKSISQIITPSSNTNQTDKIEAILSKKNKLQSQLKAIQGELGNFDQIKIQSKDKIPVQIPAIEHKMFIERMIKVRKISENKRKMMLQYQQNKNMQSLIKQQQLRKLSDEQKRIERQKSFKLNMQQLQKKKEIQSKERIQSLRRYKSVIEQKRRHQLMKQKYQNCVLFPILQQQKKVLQQRSSRFKGYSIEEIHNFERQYIKLHQSKSPKQKNQNEELWHYKPPSFSPKVFQMLEQEKVQQKIRAEEKKRALQQKISRKNQYAQYVKQSIPVIIDEKKKLQMQNSSLKLAKIEKNEIQLRKLGNKYMFEGRLKAKSELKKDNYSMREDSKQPSIKQIHKKSNTSMSHHQHDKFISEAHQNRISRILASNTIQKSQKLEKLKIEVNKLSQRAKRKQEMGKIKHSPNQSQDDLEQLLSSIKAKVGMMQIYKG